MESRESQSSENKGNKANRNYSKTCIVTDCEHHIYNKDKSIKMFR